MRLLRIGGSRPERCFRLSLPVARVRNYSIAFPAGFCKAHNCQFLRAPPNLALMVIGRTLALAHGEVSARPLPEPLARIVLQIEQREVCDA